MIDLDFDEKMQICYEEMANEYKISEQTAKYIISDLDIYDQVIDYYREVIDEKAQEKEDEWEREIKMNPDLYSDDIHGGL